MADEEIVIGLRAAFGDFIKEFKKLTNDVARSSQDIQDSLNQAFDTKKAQANIKGLAAEQKKSFQVIQSYSKGSAVEYQKNGVAIRDFRGSLTGLSQQQVIAAGATDQASSAMSRYRKQQDGAASTAPALRYALYDVANNLRQVATAAAALAVLPIGFSIKYERDFANVARTSQATGDALTALRADLVEIAQTSPISWQNITQIATLAGQLNIAEEQIADFTETVAKFAATTDVSVEGSATAFGRLDQLIDGIDGQFDNLGSAILAVGVDSVATESQIVAVSTQIASMGNLAGLTAPEIIGLSGALASLGIRPELARGTVTRLFSQIGKAAATGGRELEEFGRITGRSASEFTSAWQDRPAEVIQDFFEGINKEGPEAERTLRQLGITSVRDIPAILRLAQSSDEVRRLIALSNEEFVNGTKVTEQYGIISSTVAEQLNRLVQNFGILAATIGDSVNPLSVLVGGLNAAVEGITAFAQIPAGQIVFGFGVALAAVTALLATYGAIIASVVAGVIAFRFAKKELGESFDFLTPKILISAKALQAFLAKATTAGVASQGAAVKVGLLGRALSFAGPIGIALTAISAIGIAVSLFAKEAENAEDKANRLGVSMEALGSAIESDTAALENGEGALRQYEISAKKTSDALEETAQSATDFLGAEEQAPAVIDATTEALDRQTKALGENATEFVKNQVLKDEDIRGLFSDPAAQEAFIQAGGDPTELLLSGLEGTSDEYIDGLLKFYNNAIEQLRSRRKDINVGDVPGVEIGGEEYTRIAEQIAFYEAQLKTLDGPLRDNLQATNATKEAYDAASASGEFFAEAQEGVAQKTTIANDAIKGALDSLFGEANFIQDVSDSVNNLGEAFRTSGEEAFSSTGAIQDVINTIANNAPLGDTNIILGNLGGLLAFLQTLGPAAAGGVATVTNAIVALGGEAGYAADESLRLAAAQSAITGFDVAEVFNRINTSAGGAAKKVETLAEKFDKLTESIFGPINAAQAAAQSIADLGESYAELGEDAFFASSEIQDAVSNILTTSGSAEEGVANLNALYARLAQTVGSDTAPSLAFLRNVINQVAQEFGVAQDAVAGFANIDLDFFNRGIRQAQQEVRTLLDYAGDLEGVISRAFDIRFANTFAIDEIAAAWFDLGSTVEDARYQVDELIASQQDLGSDRALKEYFLSVAEAYNDTLRAAQLRKEISELDRQQAQNARELAEAQQIAGGDLTTQGPGARQNRAALLDLVRNYQDYITSLAESGASQEELTAATEEARREFIQQARELGFQEDVVLQYAQAFDDVRTAIDRVPRDITIDFNANPALQALNELNAKLNSSIDLARELNRVSGTPSPAPSPAPSNQGRKLTVAEISAIPLSAFSTKQRTADGKLTVAEISKLPLSAFFANGGFTGRGGRMEPAGIVHRGEYVVPKQYVNQSSGLPDPSFLTQLQNGVRGYAQGGFVGGGGMAPGDAMMVELSPYDRKLLENAGNVQLRVDGKVVASATNRSNFNEARRGSN